MELSVDPIPYQYQKDDLFVETDKELERKIQNRQGGVIKLEYSDDSFYNDY